MSVEMTVGIKCRRECAQGMTFTKSGDLAEHMYCSEQIHIPPSFPYILRQYCKAAIRTQPYDLLRWSAAYFRAMANGEEPPVKKRMEFPYTDLPSGLTPGFLKILLRQLRKKHVVPTELLYKKWDGLCLHENVLKEFLYIGNFEEEVDVLQFVAIAAGHLTNSLKETMILLCELLTDEPDGGSAMIPFYLFCDLYKYLAKIDCGPIRYKERRAILSNIMPDLIKASVIEQPHITETKQTEFKGVCEAESVEVEKITDIADETKEQEDETIPESLAKVVVDKAIDMISKTDSEENMPTTSSSIEMDTRESNVHEPVSKMSAILTGEIVSKTLSIVHNEPEVIASEVLNEIVDIVSKIADDSVISHPTVQIHESITNEPEKPHEVVKEKDETKTEDVKEISSDKENDKDFQKLQEKKKYQLFEVLGIGPIVSDKQLHNVITFLHYWSARQEGMIKPRNIQHFLCPPLDALPFSQKYNDYVL